MEYLHVTDILKIIDQGYSRIELAKMARAQQIGTEFHKYALAGMKGVYLPPLKDPEISGIVMVMVDVFKNWVAMAVKEVLCIEEELQYPKFGITGRCDVILKLTRDRFWRVIDLKSVALVTKVTGLQLAAYEFMAGVKYDIKRWESRAALQFDKQGKKLLPRLIEFRDPLDLDAFFLAQKLKNHLQKGGMGR